MFVTDLLVLVVIFCTLRGMSSNGVSSPFSTQSQAHEMSTSSSSLEFTGEFLTASAPQPSKPLLLLSPSSSSTLSSPMTRLPPPALPLTDSSFGPSQSASLPDPSSAPLSPAPTSPLLQTLTLSPKAITASEETISTPEYSQVDVTPSPPPITASEETESTTEHSWADGIDRYFYWDKERLSAKDYQQNLCPARCDGDKIIYDMNIRYFNDCRSIECMECQCERPSCEVYGTCCPDISEPFIELDAKSYLYLLEQHGSSQDYTWKVSQSETFGSSTPATLDNGNTANPIANGVSLDGIHSDSFAVQNGSDFSGWDKEHRGPNLLCDSYFNHDIFPYLHIRSCPPDFMLDSVKFLCEINPLPHQVTTYTYLRVTDRATNVTYYNQYCAECNGVIELVPWLLRIDCHHSMYVYSATNLQELLRLSLPKQSSCEVVQDIPPDIKAVECNSDYYRQDKLIDKCNVTGWWTTYDEDVKHSCEGPELSSVKYRVTDLDTEDKNLYKNVFCYICNNERYPTGTIKCNSSVLYPNFPVPPFSLLFGFTQPRTPENNGVYVSPFIYNANCTDLEWPSPNGDCLTLQCSPGKVPNGTRCVTALPTINRLGYNLQLWFIPDGNATLELSDIVLAEAMSKFIDTFSEGIFTRDPPTEFFELGFRQIVSRPTDQPGGEMTGRWAPCTGPELCRLHHFEVEGPVVASRDLSRDEFENDLMLNILNRGIAYGITGGIEMILKPSLMMTALGLLYNDRFTGEHETFEIGGGSAFQWNMPDDDEIQNVMNLFLNATNLLSCSFVSFDKSTYAVTWYSNNFPTIATIILKLQVTNVTFSEVDDFNQLIIDSHGTLQICIDLLNQKVAEIETYIAPFLSPTFKSESKAFTSTFAQYVLTLICMCASMFCLAVTLLTYFRFSVLRSVAGKNTMFLCASLLLAQAFLLAAAHANGPSPLCTLFGILTHFMWLCMFCWSFICCFHMFRVFTAKTRNLHSTDRSERMQLLKRVVTSVLTPALIIVIVVVTSYLSSETAEIGYGDRACYLDSNLLIGVSMILPLAVVLVCNTTFFIITVIKIHDVRKLQSQDFFEDRQNLYVYIKLSTMTGTFWAIFIVAEAVDLDEMRFIAIVLNGLQGVFIFISYICNVRILNLYRHSLGLEPLSTTSSSEQQARGICSVWSRLASAICPGNQENTTDRECGHSANENVGQKVIDTNDLDLKIENENSKANRNKL